VNSKSTTIGALMVATSALLFAAKGTLIKYIYTLGVSVSDLMILRLLFSAPIYLCVAIMHWPDKENMPRPVVWLGVIASGICANYLASYFDMLGLEIISVGLERVILYTYPAFVVIFSAWLFKRRLAPILLFYIVLSYVGLFLVFYADVRIQPSASIPTTIKGSLFVLASAMTFAIYVVGGERYMRSMSSMLFTATAMLGACGMMTVHYVTFNSPPDLLQFSLNVYGWCLLLAVLFTVVPAFMLAAGILRIGSAKAGGIGMIGPLGTLLIAALVLGEAVTFMQVAGFVVVVFAIHRLHKA
jgi:drug/metabolite transporter (DMT)-like permease